VLVGVLAPILVITVIVVGNNRAIMRNQAYRLPTNCFLILTAAILIAADLLFFYGLLVGRVS
jgi:Mn2+/Fe2+ NRAMP family transporter